MEVAPASHAAFLRVTFPDGAKERRVMIDASRRFDGVFDDRKPAHGRIDFFDTSHRCIMMWNRDRVDGRSGPVLKNWCAFARLFLKHVNPHTGRAWGEEPALLFLPLVNEGAFSNPKTWASLARIPAFRAAFAKWIRQERERAPDAFPEAVGEEPPEDLNRIGARHSAVYANFLAYLERTGFARMRAYLREELDVKVPLTNQNCGPHLPPMQAVREEVYDFVDDHTYVDHPAFIGKTRWAPPVRLGNGGKTQLGKGLCCAIADLSFTRLVNKPFTVTEWNFAAPGPHRAQGGLMMGAAASLQDWDGLWRFAYAHDVRDAEEQPRRIDFFNVATDPVSLAGERAGILLFLRRDVEPLATTVARLVDDGAMRPAKGTACAPVKPGWANLLWRTKVGTCRPGSLPKEAFGVPFAAKTVKDRLPADLPANGGVRIDTAKRTLAIATARTCGGYAPAEAGEVGAGDFSFAVGEDSAAVWASALDGTDLAHAGRILVSHVTDARNTGMAFSNETVSVMTKWGKAPVLVRTGTATVALNLDSPRDVRIWALDAVGNRKNTVPSEVKDGRLRFTTSVQQPFGACFHYEVAIERQLREGKK